MSLSNFPWAELLSSLGKGISQTNNIGTGLGAGMSIFNDQRQYQNILDQTAGKPWSQNDTLKARYGLADANMVSQGMGDVNKPISYDGPMGKSLGPLMPLLKSLGPAGLPLLLKSLTTQNEYDPTPRYDQSGRAYVVSKTGGGVKYLDGISDRTKVEMAPNNTAYDPYGTAPGTSFAPKDKPFDPATGAPNQTVQDYETGLRTAGRPVTSVNVTADRSFGSELGTNAAKTLDASANTARGAVQTITTANQIRGALDSGKVTAGPGASVVQTFNQIFSGDPQKLVETRKTIQGLAQLTLASRKSLAGQGSVSNNEQALLERAVSGDINSMTVPEIRAIADVADRLARISIKQNSENVGRARKAAPANQDLVDFYTVQEPGAYQPPQQRVLKYNPQTGRLE